MHSNITLVGHVGDDPRFQYTNNGTAVANFSIATNKRWTDANGETQERTTWFRVTCWRGLAENVVRYVKKGRQVMVVASQIEASAYINKQGEAAASLDVTADRVIFLGKPESNDLPTREEWDPALAGIPEDEIPF